MRLRIDYYGPDKKRHPITLSGYAKEFLQQQSVPYAATIDAALATFLLVPPGGDIMAAADSFINKAGYDGMSLSLLVEIALSHYRRR